MAEESKYVDAFLEEVSNRISEKKLLTSKDLVDLGISGSVFTLANWRSSEKGPPWFKIAKGKIRYSKVLFFTRSISLIRAIL